MVARLESMPVVNPETYPEMSGWILAGALELLVLQRKAQKAMRSKLNVANAVDS